MKGAIDFLGADKIDVLLINDQENSKTQADKIIDDYQMQAYPRVQMTNEACGIQLLSQLGHFSWGYIVVGADGTLVATSILAHQLKPALEKAIALKPEPNQGFTIRSTLNAGLPIGGMKKLKKSRKATLTLNVDIPDGQDIKAKTPKLQISYAAGLKSGTPVFPKGKPGPDGSVRYSGSIKITVPVTFPEGLPIGHYVMHGTLSFESGATDQDTKTLTKKWFADCRVM